MALPSHSRHRHFIGSLNVIRERKRRSNAVLTRWFAPRWCREQLDLVATSFMRELFSSGATAQNNVCCYYWERRANQTQLKKKKRKRHYYCWPSSLLVLKVKIFPDICSFSKISGKRRALFFAHPLKGSVWFIQEIVFTADSSKSEQLKPKHLCWTTGRKPAASHRQIRKWSCQLEKSLSVLLLYF